jgi:pimeloyl-ACP methyl ester carboxylesterase
MPPDSALRTEGSGPPVVFVHGTAGDAASLAPLSQLLRSRARVTRYDRRGTPGWPAEPEAASTAADHAADLADLVAHLGGGPVHLFGTSFGAVVALELARRHPEWVRSAALFEPAAAGCEPAPPATAALLAEFETWIARGEPERAAERFQRRVLGDAAWRRLSPEARQRARGLWRHIHADLAAIATWRVAADELRRLPMPFLLLRGGRSRDAFEAPVRALANVLPRARRATIAGAGHQSFTGAWRELADALAGCLET